METIKKPKIKDSSTPGWDKYEELKERIGDIDILEYLVKALSDQELEENMDFIAQQIDYEFKVKDSKVEQLMDDEEDTDNSLIEELASYLNTYYEDEGLEIVVEYEEGVPTIACYNYLSEEEQTSLDEVATSWLKERLPEDRLQEVYVSKDNNCFHLTLERP